jgi:transcriptional regulator with XRE-family HTH domain
VATGIDERQFFRFKRGGNPGLHTIYLLAKALKVPLKDLFEFDESKEIKRWEDEPGRNEYYKSRYGTRKRK